MLRAFGHPLVNQSTHDLPVLKNEWCLVTPYFQHAS